MPHYWCHWEDLCPLIGVSGGNYALSLVSEDTILPRIKAIKGPHLTPPPQVTLWRPLSQVMVNILVIPSNAHSTHSNKQFQFINIQLQGHSPGKHQKVYLCSINHKLYYKIQEVEADLLKKLVMFTRKKSGYSLQFPNNLKRILQSCHSETFFIRLHSQDSLAADNLLYVETDNATSGCSNNLCYGHTQTGRLAVTGLCAAKTLQKLQPWMHTGCVHCVGWRLFFHITTQMSNLHVNSSSDGH